MAESTRSRLTSDDEFWDTKPNACQTCDNNFGGVSVWCDRDKLSRFIDNVCEGDRLEFVNSNLPHLHSWAICRSFSEVNPLPWCAVQFFNRAKEEGGECSTRQTSLDIRFPASEDVIVVTSISLPFERGDKVRINNLKDEDLSPLGTGRIRKEVTYQLEELHASDAGVEVYVRRNQFKDSEDFVNYCRYDRDHQHNWCRDNNYGRVSKWYSKTNIEDFIHEVRVGDRLEFIGSSPYEPWGIYIGQLGDDLEQVVLFAHGDKTNSATSTKRLKPKLCVTSIRGVLQYDQVRINNDSDRKWTPLDRKNILKEISGQVPSRAGMHECKLSFRDSEDFVNFFRYDDWRINLGIVSDWCNNPLSLPRLQVGDRLEFRHIGVPYAHWGIYVGQWGDGHDQVVHFAPADGNGKKSSGSGSSAKDKPVLLVDDIWTFLGEVRINNKDDGKWLPLDRENILKEISRQLPGRAHMHYECKFSFKDSKDFVNHCRYYDLRINFGLVSDWCDSWQSLPRLRVGDRLESHGTGRPYPHWGIYVGDWGDDHDQVVDFALADRNGKMFFMEMFFGLESSAENKPVLNVNHINKVLGNDKVRVNNGQDHKWPPIVSTDILDEIERQLKSQSNGHKLVYNIFSYNCEHFVNHCRYGRHHSD